ncbi:glycosyltransferase [Rhodobacterales bacterium HKCCD6035]|nr:glycosyltransferase [Rhodobacterales bacterium HKCCD6035]
MVKETKVTIVTVCRNSADTIERCMKSVRSQTYTNIEHVIVDGASSDGTLDVVHKLATPDVVTVSEPDHGIYDAMNKGIRLATGDIVCFLNSDDVYSDRDVITDVVHQMASKNLDALLADICFVSKSGRVVRNYSAKDFIPSKLRVGWMPPHPGMFVTRKKIFEAGLFEPSYKIAGDYEFCIKLFNLPELSWSYYSRRAVDMALGGVSTSGLKSQYVLNCEVYRACRQHGIDINIPTLLLKYPKKIFEFFIIGRSKNEY